MEHSIKDASVHFNDGKVSALDRVGLWTEEIKHVNDFDNNTVKHVNISDRGIVKVMGNESLEFE